jgi:hypothetical protein
MLERLMMMRVHVRAFLASERSDRHAEVHGEKSVEAHRISQQHRRDGLGAARVGPRLWACLDRAGVYSYDSLLPTRCSEGTMVTSRRPSPHGGSYRYIQP